ncbi:unnamed protein product [Paramecium sonneborni]|uniref:Uncharacterized protein n=1 Tax=Paramecium sonneborni TaxID=65129 RepID=A0A8S1Q8M6_9CILI|nr:unnamed protein product [Paramecium sonneborni]
MNNEYNKIAQILNWNKFQEEFKNKCLGHNFNICLTNQASKMNSHFQNYFYDFLEFKKHRQLEYKNYIYKHHLFKLLQLQNWLSQAYILFK